MARLGEVATNLNFRQGRTQSAIIKDGTADALMGLGKATVSAVSNYKKYRKVQQAMDFQADVIEGTLGGRQGDDDPYYEALRVSHDMTTASTEFMKMVKAEPLYAEMSKEEFRAEYDAEMRSKWDAFAPESTEGFQVFAEAGLASQREALTWHAGANASYIHKQAVAASGNALLDTASQPDPTGKGVKSFNSRMDDKLGASLSQEEKNALTTSVAVTRAQQGDPRALQYALSKGLGTNPLHSDDLRKAKDVYDKGVYDTMAKQVDTARANIEMAVTNGLYTKEMGEAFLDNPRNKFKFTGLEGKDLTPQEQRIQQLNKWLLSSTANKVKFKATEFNARAMLAGNYDGWGELNQSEKTKVMEYLDDYFDSEFHKGNLSEQDVIDRKLSVSIQTGKMSNAMQSTIKQGFSSIGLVDKGEVTKQLRDSMDAYMKLRESDIGAEVAGRLMGGGAEAGTAKELYALMEYGGLTLEQGVAKRIETLNNPLEFSRDAQVKNAEYLEKQLNKYVLEPSFVEKFKGLFGKGKPDIRRFRQLLPMLNTRIRLALDDEKAGSFKEATDRVMRDMTQNLTTLGDNLLGMSTANLTERMGLAGKGVAPQKAVDNYISSKLRRDFLIPEGIELQYNINEGAMTMDAWYVDEKNNLHSITNPIPLSYIGEEYKGQLAKDRRKAAQDNAWILKHDRAKAVDKTIKDVASKDADITSLGLTEDDFKTLDKDTLYKAIDMREQYNALKDKYSNTYDTSSGIFNARWEYGAPDEVLMDAAYEDDQMDLWSFINNKSKQQTPQQMSDADRNRWIYKIQEVTRGTVKESGGGGIK